MSGHRLPLRFRQLSSVFAVTILLVCTVMTGLVRPESAAGETAMVGWMRQLGTAGDDSARGISVTGGAVYLGEGDGTDYSLHKYDTVGNDIWTREINDSNMEDGGYVTATHACSTGIYVTLDGFGVESGDCTARLHKYDANSMQAWSSHLSVDYWNDDEAIFSDSSGIYVAGDTFGPPAGERGFVRKFNSNGTSAWIREYTVASGYFPTSVSAYSSYVYVAGIAGATGESFVQKREVDDGDEIWTRLPGFAPPVVVHGISVDSGGVYVAGSAHDPSEADGRQAFVRKYDLNGNQVWTREFGSSEDDVVNAVFVNSAGVYVAGYTEGLLPGQTNKGGADAFVRKYDAGGNEIWTYQFGSSADDTITSICADAAGIYAAGDTDGAMPGLTSSGSQDVFVVQITTNNTPAQPGNIAPDDGDTGLGLTPTLRSSAFSDPDSGDTHKASQWQITTTAGDYSGYVFNSGTDTSNLTAISVPSATLASSTTYYWHVRHQDNHGAWSDWSTESRFSTGAALSVTTNAATLIGATSATLNGTLTNVGLADSAWLCFEWGLTSSYGNTTTAHGPMSAPGAWSLPLTGLTPGTTYHFRARADGNGTTAYGLDMTLTTTSASTTPPTVTTFDASNISETSATLTGDLTSLGTAPSVSVSFQWGAASGVYDYENAAEIRNSLGTFSFNLGGLSSGTTIYFRAKAAGDGTVYGLEKSFTTTVPMSVSTNAATSVGTTSATLNGNLTSLGSADNAWVCFEWGLTNSYGNTTTMQGPMWSPGTWSYPLAGLTPGTTYHFRAAAHSGTIAYGSDMSFTTGQSPEVDSLDPTSGRRGQELTVTISGAHFTGATAISFGSGITVGDWTVNGDTEITVEIAIDGDAPLGNRDVSVTTAWGTGTKTDSFEVISSGGGICNRASAEAPGARSEMTPTLAALGLALGVGYWFVKRREE